MTISPMASETRPTRLGVKMRAVVQHYEKFAIACRHRFGGAGGSPPRASAAATRSTMRKHEKHRCMRLGFGGGGAASAARAQEQNKSTALASLANERTGFLVFPPPHRHRPAKIWQSRLQRHL